MANLTPEQILRGIIDGSLTIFDFDTVTSIAQYKLRSHTGIVELTAPNLRSTGGQDSLSGCSSLRRIYLPSFNVSHVADTQYAFSSISNLETVVLPAQTVGFGSYAFRYDGKLTHADITAESLQQMGFHQTKLTVLVIRKTDGICALNSTNVFDGSAFASGGTGGILYVPQALISSYQSETNWSTILGYTNNSILSIEGSQYEHYYADGTPIPEET